MYNVFVMEENERKEKIELSIRKKFHKELRKRVITLNCQRCDTEKFIPKKYFKD